MKGRVYGFAEEDIADFYKLAENGDFRATVTETATVRKRDPRSGKYYPCYTAQLEDGTVFYMTAGFFRFVFLPACEPED